MLLRLFAPHQEVWYQFSGWQHQHNANSFGSHNLTIQQPWTTSPILPAAPRCFWIGWMQSDVLSCALRHLHLCSSMLWKLWSRIEVYSEECIVVYKILQNQNVRMCKFWSYWKYWTHLLDYCCSPRTCQSAKNEMAFSVFWAFWNSSSPFLNYAVYSGWKYTQ